MTGPQLNGWQEIQEEVLRRIRTLDWPPGHQIPNESDLAAEFGCARATVNRALQSLAESGLLERRRRAGTRVVALPIRHARLRIPVVRHEIEDSGRRYGYELLHRAIEPRPHDLADLFTGDGSGMLHVVARHLADGATYLHEDRWISPAVIPAATRADFTAISANEWLVANAPISTGEIAFTAEAATVSDAELFACRPGDSLMRGVRTTWHNAQAVTLVRQTFHPGYRLTMQA